MKCKFQSGVCLEVLLPFLETVPTPGIEDPEKRFRSVHAIKIP